MNGSENGPDAAGSGSVEPPVTAGLVDLHSHLVPAVDDGARTIDDAIEGIGRMVERGVRSIVTTPHLSATATLRPSRLAAALEPVDRAFEALSDRVAERFPDIELGRGHEMLLDVPDPDLSDSRLWLGEVPVVLVEWPGLQFPPGTPRVLDEMVRGGIRPVVAHPERYRVHNQRLTTPGEWREAGAWLQMNYGSLVGRYGPQARAHALTLLERGWVDCFASDFHGRAHLRLYIRECRELFMKMDHGEAWDLLTAVNPDRIRRGEEPLAVPPVSIPIGVVERIRTLFGSIR